jgi:HTH-type transcriptional regulator / antitoxin HigA
MLDLLNGKQELNVRMIKVLAKRFGVSEQTFLG